MVAPIATTGPWGRSARVVEAQIAPLMPIDSENRLPLIMMIAVASANTPT